MDEVIGPVRVEDTAGSRQLRLVVRKDHGWQISTLLGFTRSIRRSTALNIEDRMSSKRAGEAVTGSAKKAKTAAITSFFKKDAVIHSSTPRNAKAADQTTPFDRDSWLSGLDDRQRDLLRLEIDTLHPSWLGVLHAELTKPYFLSLKEFLAKERRSKTVFPPEEDVYSWSRYTPFESVRCVILGQDPYHNVGQAHGLCFSVKPPVPPPPSLKNIFKCLKIDYPGFTTPKHGSLVGWAESGVLLLNTCLTVVAHQANSHANKGWEQFTQRVIDLVNDRRKEGVVFMAWGTPAGKRCSKIDRSRHLKLESVHPSPLSAARGFFECRHFVKANDWLEGKYGIEGKIDWDSLAGNKDERRVEGVSKEVMGKKQPGVEDEVGQVDSEDAKSGVLLKPSLAKAETANDFGITAEDEEAMAASIEQLDGGENDKVEAKAVASDDVVSKDEDKVEPEAARGIPS